MREIKFRAWDKEQKKMWWFDLLWGNTTAHGSGWIGMVESPDEGKYRHSVCGDDNRIQVDPIDKVIMQYTGLLDKNGKEICEGDILLVPDEYTDRILDDGSGPTEPCNHLATVTFQGGSFGVDIPDSANMYRKGFWSFDYISSDIGDTSDTLEVIGNIWENPMKRKLKI